MKSTPSFYFRIITNVENSRILLNKKRLVFSIRQIVCFSADDSKMIASNGLSQDFEESIV